MTPRAAIIRSALPGAALALALAACAEPTRSAPGGDYVAHLESPYSVEGATVIELTSRELEAAFTTHRVLVGRALSDSTVAFLLVNPPADRLGLPLALTVRMAPGAVPPRARVVTVASVANLVRDFPAAYRVRYTRPDGPPADRRAVPGAAAAGDAPVRFARIAEALLGGDPLTPEEEARVDAIGNRNGLLDPGDARAFLQAHPAEIPASPVWTAR